MNVRIFTGAHPIEKKALILPNCFSTTGKTAPAEKQFIINDILEALKLRHQSLELVSWDHQPSSSGRVFRQRSIHPPRSWAHSCLLLAPRSIKDDQLSDGCLVAGCLRLEPVLCSEGDGCDLATAIMDLNAYWMRKWLLLHQVKTLFSLSPCFPTCRTVDTVEVL